MCRVLQAFSVRWQLHCYKSTQIAIRAKFAQVVRLSAKVQQQKTDIDTEA